MDSDPETWWKQNPFMEKKIRIGIRNTDRLTNKNVQYTYVIFGLKLEDLLPAGHQVTLQVLLL